MLSVRPSPPLTSHPVITGADASARLAQLPAPPAESIAVAGKIVVPDDEHETSHLVRFLVAAGAVALSLCDDVTMTVLFNMTVGDHFPAPAMPLTACAFRRARVRALHPAGSNRHGRYVLFSRRYGRVRNFMM